MPLDGWEILYNLLMAIDKNDIILEVNGVHKNFQAGRSVIKVLKEINLKIPRGEFIIVFGPSGCGKSTLLNIVLGIEDPTQGEVLMKGTNIFSMDEDKRGYNRLLRVGMVHQMAYWIKSLNVLENVALPLLIKGIHEKSAKEKAMRELKKLSIDKLAHQLPTQLSGGQQQRVSLSRALVTDPEIIIADEPTGNLDTTNSDMVMGIFDKLNRDEGKTVLLVTHNQAYWEVGTRRIEMQDGQVLRDVHHAAKISH